MSLEPPNVASSFHEDLSPSSFVWMHSGGSSSTESNQDFLQGMEYVRTGEMGSALGHFQRCASLLPFCNYAVMEIEVIDAKFDEKFDPIISKMASDGNPDAQFLNALIFSNRFTNVSQYTAETFPKSVLHLYAASTASHPGALMTMGYRHLKGYGVPKRCETAALNYLEVAKPVANIYASSVPRAVELVRLGIEKDKKILSISEISLFTEVAQVNQEIALAVAKRYLLGTDGFVQDYALARKFLSLVISAAEEDSKMRASAFALTGYLHALGLGVPQDMQTAESLFEQGLEDGMGMNGLGFVRFKQERFAEAFALFNASASAGSADGMFNLASFFLTGTGTAQNFQKAFMFYTEALKRGHTPAGYALAVMHLNGIGTVRDCLMAVSLLKEVAERSDYVSSLLRSAYALVSKGETETASLQFLKLAEAGHQVAQENLAHLIDSGQAGGLLGISSEWRKIYSQRFYEMAAEQGSVKSCVKLGDLAFYGGGLKADLTLENEAEEGGGSIMHFQETTPDFSSAVRWYKQARDQGSKVSSLVGGGVPWVASLVATAEFNLGYMHHWGIGVRKNLVEAAKHYKRSIPETSHGRKILEWIVDTLVHSPVELQYRKSELHSHAFPIENEEVRAPKTSSHFATLLNLLPADYRLTLVFFLSWLLIVLVYVRLNIR